MKNPLDETTLAMFLDRLPGEPADLIRKDKNFKQLGLKAEDYTTPQEVVSLLLEHPELMQRPVILRGTRAVIARPSEKILELLD